MDMRRHTLLEVGVRRLAKLLSGAREVEHIVHNLVECKQE
jgi:hypothetical protein